MIDIRERIAELLTERNMTRYELAKRSGVPLSTISSIFIRETIPQFDTIYKICEGLDVSMAYFSKELIIDEWDCLPGALLAEVYDEMDANERRAVTNYIRLLMQGHRMPIE